MFKIRGKAVPGRIILTLCIASFLVGTLFTRHTWPYTTILNDVHFENHEHKMSFLTPKDCDRKHKLVEDNSRDIMGEVAKNHQPIQSLDKTISTLEMELEAARTSLLGPKFMSERMKPSNKTSLQKAFVVIGEKLNKLEKEKRIIIRFVIGHSATPRGVLDRAIDMEEEKYKDFLRLNHVEGYHELSIKTRLYFSKVVSIWDAEFYVKVDDDVHVNLGMLMTTLARYRSKPRTYLGCMKSGPVLFQKSVCFH
uniref:Hexosyltransferase n=1 Tax=Lactuca sativa TaxID=4236 RepID=A0A9R1XEF5_LACSA|nr:hypothetical protein LSAT_V11C400208600 [Lactuca sativa]